MNRKIIAVAAALVVCIVATLAVASASPTRRGTGVAKAGQWGRTVSSADLARAKAPAAPQGAETFTVKERETGFKFVNTDGSNFTTGDYFLFRDKLLRNGQQVGTDNIKCTASFRLILCEAAFSFNGSGGIGRGQIAADGVVYNRNPFIVPITGGTREFSGTGGQVVIRNVSNNVTSLTFEVTR